MRGINAKLSVMPMKITIDRIVVNGPIESDENLRYVSILKKRGRLSLSNMIPATRAPPRNKNGIWVPGLNSNTMVESRNTKRNMKIPKIEAITPSKILSFPLIMSDGKFIRFENSF